MISGSDHVAGTDVGGVDPISAEIVREHPTECRLYIGGVFDISTTFGIESESLRATSLLAAAARHVASFTPELAWRDDPICCRDE